MIELNTFALSFTVTFPCFFPIYASASCAVLDTNILNLFVSQSDNLLWSFRLISGVVDRSGEIYNMVAMKDSGRSIFHFISITPSIADANIRTNNKPVCPQGNRIVGERGLLLSEILLAK